MKRKVDIEMDFSRAVSQAQELEELSRELSRIATGQVEEALSTLSIAWQGDNAEIFCDRADVIVRELLSIADDLKRASKNISQTAGIVYSAEKAAIQLGF